MALSKTVREGGGECRACSPTSANAPNPTFRMLEHRPFRPFKTSEEYLYAMKEDLAEWLHTLYNLDITVDNFFEVLETGVVLCQHANKVNAMAAECRKNSVSCPKFPDWEVTYRTDVSHNTFHSRDNVSNFIRWCRALDIMDCLLFETDDLVMRKNEKSFILCLLEVARRGSKVGMLAPLLVQMEEEIDRDIAKDQSKAGRGAFEDRGTSPEPFLENPTRVVNYGPMPQVTNNDLKSLDEMVRDLVNRCSCPTQFFMERISEGKYRIGDSKLLIYVRILRNHVMVRVGGGWDTLAHFLDKHDPCRCRQGHRTAIGAKLTVKFGQSSQAQTHMEVLYTRSPVSPLPPSTPFLMPPPLSRPPPPPPPPPCLNVPPSQTAPSSPPRQRRLSNSSSSASSCCSHKLSNGSLASLPGDSITKPCNGHHKIHTESGGTSPRNSTAVDVSAQHSSGDSCCSEQSDEGYKSGVMLTPEKSPLLSVSKINTGLPTLNKSTTDISRPTQYSRNSVTLDLTDPPGGGKSMASPSSERRPITSSPRPAKGTATTPKTPVPKSKIPYGVSPLASPILSSAKRIPPSAEQQQQRLSHWEATNGVVRRRRLSGDHGTGRQAHRNLPRSISTYDSAPDNDGTFLEFTRSNPARKSLQNHHKSMSMLPNGPIPDKYNTWSSSSKRSSRPNIAMDTFINPKLMPNGGGLIPKATSTPAKSRISSIRSPRNSRQASPSPEGALQPLILEMIRKGVHINKELYQKLLNTLVDSSSNPKACPPDDNFTPDTSCKQSGMASPDSGSDVSFPNDEGVAKRTEDDTDNPLTPQVPRDNPKWTSSPRRYPDSKIPVLMDMRRPPRGGGP